MTLEEFVNSLQNTKSKSPTRRWTQRASARESPLTFGKNMKPIYLIILWYFAAIFSAEAQQHSFEVSIDYLADQHVGRIVTIFTTQKGIPVVGSAPPEGMITGDEKGAIFHGRLDRITASSLFISAPAGTANNPDYRKDAEIEKKTIRKILLEI